jgi:hypothetical protein
VTLGYTDLFAAGLGLDISGAVLLARGLRIRPDEYARRLTAAPHSLAASNVRAAEDYADGKAGVWALGLGFVLQASATHCRSVASRRIPMARGPRSSRSAAPSRQSPLVAILARVVRWPWTRRWLLDLARWDEQGMPHPTPNGRELLSYARVLGRDVRDDYQDFEGLWRCGHRVWRVERVRDPTRFDDNGQQMVLGPPSRTRSSSPDHS